MMITAFTHRLEAKTIGSANDSKLIQAARKEYRGFQAALWASAPAFIPFTERELASSHHWPREIDKPRIDVEVKTILPSFDISENVGYRGMLEAPLGEDGRSEDPEGEVAEGADGASEDDEEDGEWDGSSSGPGDNPPLESEPLQNPNIGLRAHYDVERTESTAHSSEGVESEASSVQSTDDFALRENEDALKVVQGLSAAERDPRTLQDIEEFAQGDELGQSGQKSVPLSLEQVRTRVEE